VRSAVKVPIIVKVTPQVIDLMTIVNAAKEAGADAVTVTNRYMGFAVDIEKGEPYIGGWAAVGGPWIKPLSLRWIAECYRTVSLPVFGSNGAANWSDVVEFMMAGASLVQMASAFMLEGPDLIPKILEGMEDFLKRKSYRSMKDITGLAVQNALPYKELHRLPVQRMHINQDTCIQCGNCLNACYYSAITQQEETVNIGPGCMGCELCLAFCPVPGAIEKEIIEGG
jgi:dihydroorotate dehydrogenase (fumarate)/dihydropyrimidine dehydrogenase (NAD+) subunit PreA